MARAAAGRWDIFVPYTGPPALAVAICAVLIAAPALPGIAANAEHAKIPEQRCTAARCTASGKQAMSGRDDAIAGTKAGRAS